MQERENKKATFLTEKTLQLVGYLISSLKAGKENIKTPYTVK